MLFISLRGKFTAGPVLEGPRTYLRPPTQRDWRDWSQLRAASRTFLAPWEPTWPADALTRGSYRRRLRQYRAEVRDGSGQSFFLFRGEDDALLGGITLSNLRRGVAQSASLGYWIGAPVRRQGYMTEALAAIVDYGFDRLGLHRLEAACLPENEASQGLLLKAGFKEEGYARQYLKIDGRWRDHRLFALLRSDPRPSTR
ncbi:MAG: GNAT family N-acetyltransferase [Kiloniellales bacterium]